MSCQIFFYKLLTPDVLLSILNCKILCCVFIFTLSFLITGAVLASPISDEVLDAMKSLMGLKNTSYFIGIKADYFTGPFTSVEGL